MTGKRWLESKEQPKPTTEIFPQVPKSPEPVFMDQKPLIPNKNPTHANNSLSIKKTTAKSPEKLISKISPKTPEKFLLNNSNKKSDQLKTNQPLPLIANQEQKPTESKVILLVKINQLEKQLKQTATERDNLKQLVQQEKQRADNYQQQLKIIVRTLKQ